MNVRVIQICDGSYVCFFFFREFFPSLAVIQDKLEAVHLHMAIAEDMLVVGSQATEGNQAAEEDNQDITEVDIQVVKEGNQGIIEGDIPAAVEGSQGTVRDSRLVVDILAIVVGILDIIGIHKAVALPLAKVLPFST